MKSLYKLVFFASAVNNWTVSLIRENILILILALLLAYLLFIYFKRRTLEKKKRGLVILLTIFLIIFVTFNSFDSGLFTNSEVAKSRILKQQNYYSKELGRIYGNKIGIYYFNEIKPVLGKYFENIAYSVNYSSYYTSFNNLGKPRLPLISLPFLVIGALGVLQKSDKKLILIGLSLLLVSGFISTGSTFGLLLFYPIIIALIAFGFLKITKV